MIQPPRVFINCLQFILIVLFFTSCGENGEENSQLTASAGDDSNVLVGEQVNLNGGGSSDSQGNPFEYSWRFISKPPSSNAEMQDGNTANSSFTPDKQGKYKIELTISNTTQNSDTLTVAAFSVIDVNGDYEILFPGPDVGIREYTSACGCLIATCEFTEIGGISADKIAYYNGSSWTALGCGLEEGSIFDMVEFKGELYVTGQFEEIGCIPAINIARWNCENKTWKAVEEGLTGGEAPFGHALAVYENELYVGGRMTKAGNVDVANLAKWDGTGWSAVGAIENGSVRSLEVYKQNLYAGGFFDAVNGINTGSIASYNGTSWVSLGSTDELELKATGAVKHMAVFKDILYIAGEFSTSNDDVSELIMWNGSQLSDFGRAFSFYQNSISELTTIDDKLFIGGSFNNVVASQANNILQWDGDDWGIMSAGVTGDVLAIEYYKNKIYIGGDFLSAGGATAENISVWTEN